MKTLKLATAIAVLAAPVLAEGDAAAGEQAFNRQCVSCHVVQNAAGEVLAGRNAKTGPNLFGIIGRAPGSVDGFSYGDDIVAAQEFVAAWDEEQLAAYMQDPTAWLRSTTGSNSARSKMSFKVRQEADAENIAAFLATFAE